MALKNTHKYDDIIHLPHPVSQRRSRMSNYDRAAQFSPFAALTGFEETIEETHRRTDSRIELDESEKLRLNDALRQLQQRLPEGPWVAVTWFVYDLLKSGGAYVTEPVQLRRIDSVTGTLLLTDGREIPIGEIIGLELL